MATTAKFDLVPEDGWTTIADIIDTNIIQVISGGPVLIRVADSSPDDEVDFDGLSMSVTGLRELSIDSNSTGGFIYARVLGSTTVSLIILSIPIPPPEEEEL